MNQFVKQAYVQGLAARAILRARIMQKRAGIGDYAMAGGVGAGGGALIGALINYARKKSLLQGALAGAGVGGVAGLGYQGIRDLLRKPLVTTQDTSAGKQDIVKTPSGDVGIINPETGEPVSYETSKYYNKPVNVGEFDLENAVNKLERDENGNIKL